MRSKHRAWKVLAASAGLVTLGVAGVAVAQTKQGVGHGFYSGDVNIATRAAAGGGFEMVDPTRGGLSVHNLGHGNLSTKSAPATDPDNEWNSDVDAYYAAEQSWDYFAGAHQRRGIAGDGVGPLVLTNAGDPAESDHTGGAEYIKSCRCIIVSSVADGQRSWEKIDVIGHELTHGVTSLTASLSRGAESRALDEATSDIFGTLIEFRANNATDRPDYTIAEGIGDKPLRFMDDPTKDGVSKGCWEPGIAGPEDRSAKKKIEGMDDGGDDPHLAAAIADKFFFQLAVGSGKSAWGDSPTCNGAPAVTGIGNEKAGKIWFRALTRYMMPNTNYAGARATTLRAAGELYGRKSTEAKAVEAAWNAVGVDGSQPVPAAPVAPLMEFIGGSYNTVGEDVTLYMTAPDPQRQTVTYAATGLPAGLSINRNTGLISGRPTTAGDFDTTVTATDPDRNVARQSIGWTIAAS